MSEPAKFMARICFCETCQTRDHKSWGLPFVLPFRPHDIPSTNFITDKDCEKSMSRIRNLQDGIPRYYCTCGTLVMLITNTRASGVASGDYQLDRYLKENNLVNRLFSRIPLCWFCTREK